MRKINKLGLLLFCLPLFCLCSCSVLAPVDVPAFGAPNMNLLAMTPYVDEELPAAQAPRTEHLRVDLWLDGSQLMGGINASKASIYPHFSRKYHEGGFHYRYENTVGFYENVLNSMLAATDGSLTRVLRYGNERLPDAFLYENGLTDSAPTDDILHSLRRDMLTYAINPMPTLFSSFSDEDMKNSFYTLGTPKLDQLSHMTAQQRALLENPTQAAQMSATLQNQITAIAMNDAPTLTAISQDSDYPLLYALENLDLSRLSVITCDPATLRRLSGVNADGSTTPYVQALLEKRGVFDKGLCVGLYTFTLDYMGQLTAYGSADFSEPLIWGRMRYNSKTRLSSGAMPMPRTLLALVLGSPAHVTSFTEAFNAQLASNATLKELRGDDRGELTYTQNGQKVVAQPFSFAYHYTCITRPSAGYYSQHTKGAALTVAMGEGTVADTNGLDTAVFTLSAPTGNENRKLTLSLPTQALPDGVSVDLSKLQNQQANVLSMLVLTQTLPIDSTQQSNSNAQIITLRDRHYVFSELDAPFAANASLNPFSLESITLSTDGKYVSITVAVNSARLEPGYYRVRLCADSARGQLAYAPIEWVNHQNAQLTNNQISEWESFSQLITSYERKQGSIPKWLSHAWGAGTPKTYHGTPIPDCPPVYLAQGLSELLEQLRAASDVSQSPYLRYVFDVFVTSDEGI